MHNQALKILIRTYHFETLTVNPSRPTSASTSKKCSRGGGGGGGLRILNPRNKNDRKPQSFTQKICRSSLLASYAEGDVNDERLSVLQASTRHACASMFKSLVFCNFDIQYLLPKKDVKETSISSISFQRVGSH